MLLIRKKEFIEVDKKNIYNTPKKGGAAELDKLKK